MSSSRRHSPTRRNAFRANQAGLWGALTLCILAGCSRQEPAATKDDWSLDSGNALHVETRAGGLDTSYTAHFDGPHVNKISEVRTSPDRAKQGDYEFNGARLIRYKGAALLSEADIEVSFDLQGALTEAKGADEAEVSAIRDRASLLRSLAQTKRTTQSHGG